MGITMAVVKARENGGAVMSWKIDEKHPAVIKARALGINVEYLLGEDADANPKGIGWIKVIQSEIDTVEEARSVRDWRKIASPKTRQHLRAILAERKTRDLEGEIEVMKRRFKQSDLGVADWNDERDGLLAEIKAKDDRIAELEDQLSAEDQKSSEESYENDKTSESLREYRERLDAKDNEIAELAQKVEALEALVAAKSAEIERILATVELRAGRINQLEATIRRLTADKEELEKLAASQTDMVSSMTVTSREDPPKAENVTIPTWILESIFELAKR